MDKTVKQHLSMTSYFIFYNVNNNNNVKQKVITFALHIASTHGKCKHKTRLCRMFCPYFDLLCGTLIR